ncbi:response regulator transcription factor [Brooklawnia cerclae]|uniref:DNA-binding NarL/FixJ family response regulator n=1 Tax=Brooklawnia cerclae TaxID=349934 RepID=A0ABX0SAJ6_9ACTN|nr:response regulator transcription factor [Brooklawnia cerclae]NIH55430.1 DNA-binding NarL/FixJ family response regulator [Brooklawnia cerclae]
MITTLIVDDAAAVRASLRLVLETTDDIEVIGEAGNGVDAVRLARQLHPDVVLMDLRMPDGDGLDAIEALAGIGVEKPVPIIVFTTFNFDEYLYGAFERGAVGFLLKKNPGDIAAAVRSAVNANALQSPAVRARLQADFAREASRSGQRTRAGEDQRLTSVLTDRELEVITALADGLSNKQIASRLSLGENTVKWHISNMLDKTGASDRTQLVLWAVQRGLNPSQ